MASSTVKIWTEDIPHDPNHKCRLAWARGIYFCAFPYQSYYGRVGWYHAIIGDMLVHENEQYTTQYSVRIERIDEKGCGYHFKYQSFTNLSDAFDWAAEIMLEHEHDAAYLAHADNDE